MLQTAPYDIKDFSGGITDYYVGALPNRYQVADNLLIERQGNVGKLVQRPGSEVFSLGWTGQTHSDQIPAGSQRVGALCYHVWVNSGDNYNTLTSRSLLYVSGSDLYRHEVGVTGIGSFDEANGLTGNDAFFGATTASATSMARWADGIYLFTSDALTHGPQKTIGTPDVVYNVGLPLMVGGGYSWSATPVATPGTAGSTFNYLYRILLKFTTAINGVTYTWRGPSYEFAAAGGTAIAAGAGNTMALTSLSVVTNGTRDNYPVGSASLDTEIYRTIDAGTVFYLVTSPDNGSTSSYNDVMTDAVLQTKEILYTESGVPEHDEAPRAKYLHVCNNRAYYANTRDTHPSVESLHPGRIYQSVAGNSDAVPGDWYADIPEQIVGLSSVKNVPVIFGDLGGVYSVNGVIDDLGGGDMVPELRDTNVGCLSNMGIVQAMEGVFWPGFDGFYYFNGYSAQIVSESLRATYKTFTNTPTKRRRIVGKYHPHENRIYWTAQVGDVVTDCNKIFVLDLNFGLSNDMPFTTWSGGDNFRATSLEVVDLDFDRTTNTLTRFNPTLVRGDTRGYALVHRESLLSDHKVDATVGAGNAVALWGYTAIIVDYTSAAMDMGTTGVRKWVPSMTVVCKNEGDLSLQINSINDDGRLSGVLKPIRFRDGDEYTGMIDEFRRFPAAGGFRCEFKQVQFTNAYVVVTSSTETGVLATISGAANTATIASGTWPTQAIDYYLAFSNDDYVIEYLVTARTDTILTFTDTGNVAPTGSLDWVLRGKPVDEYFSFHSYTLNVAPLSQTQTPFHSTTTGEP